MNEVPHSLSELEAFCVEMNLYLKPYARINITVPLPQLKQPGQSISNWDLMEKIKKALTPIQLSSIKVTKSTIEMVRFEAELANRKVMSKVVKALDGYSLKVFGFFEPLKVRVAEAKSDFPTRHDWDEFFRNAEDMDELKAGERPDTIYLAKLPTNWFTDKREGSGLPSTKVLQQVFEQFGKIRCIDVPLLDKYRKQMPSDISGIRSVGFSFGQEIFFEAYVQFYEYISFVRTMDTLRNMKLVRIMDDNKMFEAAIKVDFDKTKHLSEKKIQKRDSERRRLRAEEKRKVEEEDERKRAELESKHYTEKDYGMKTKQYEEKRQTRSTKEKHLPKPKVISRKMAGQERKERVKRDALQPRKVIKEPSASDSEKHSEHMKRSAGEGINLDAVNDTEQLEVRLRATLLKEQEMRIRKRIEAKMLLKNKGITSKNGGTICNSDSHGEKKRKRISS